MNLFKDKKKDNTNWGQSVTGVVIKENKFYLLVTLMVVEKVCLLFLGAM